MSNPSIGAMRAVYKLEQTFGGTSPLGWTSTIRQQMAHIIDQEYERPSDDPPLMQVVAKAIADVYTQRDEILKAFIAKYGFQPDECCQVQQGAKWWVEKRVPDMTAAELREAEILFWGADKPGLAHRFAYYAKRFDPVIQTPTT